jgi:hypothetical protein
MPNSIKCFTDIAENDPNCLNDIVREINAEIKLFSDDTSLYLIVNNPNDTAFLPEPRSQSITTLV